MRFLTTTALALCLPGIAAAEDVLLRADIAEALIYADSAEVTRRVAVDLPPGSHVLTIPMRDLVDPALIEVQGPDGARLGIPQPVERIAIAEGLLDTEAEAEARDAVETAERALREVRDALDRRDAVIEGLEVQLMFLTSLAHGGPEASAMSLDPVQLLDILSTLGDETARVGLELQSARAARREDEIRLEDRLRDLGTAQAELGALNPFGPESRGIRIVIDAPEGASGEIALSYLTGGVTWRPDYALRLDTETAALDIERIIALSVRSQAPWRDVAARFSTAIPSRQRVPATLWPDPVRIGEPAPPMPAPAVRESLGAADMAEAVVVAEPVAEMVTQGLSVVYDYAAPVTVGETGSVSLPLDTLSLEMDLENRAVPRQDATAFLIAMGENTTGEAILPGRARFFRDGDLVGSDILPLIPAGAEAEIAFGPLDHLQLTWTDLSRDEGDRGVFVSENEMQRRVAFTVENTSASAEEVHLLYAAPFSEQEDLELTVDWSRAPDAVDVDDIRGLSEWVLTVPAGEETRIEMTVEMRWPDDMVLQWWP